MDMNNLNEKQKEAVLAKGIVRVIAGAGSGKTRVLTHRIAYLISHCSVNPRNILAVTFTRKAAGEMKERARKLVGKKAEQLNCGTFHSICFRILRETSSLRARGSYEPEANGNRFSILDDQKRRTYLKKVLGPEGINLDLKPGRVGSIISLAKNRLMDAEVFSSNADTPFMQKVADAFTLYEQWKERDRLIDYDDLLLRCWKLLKTDPKVRKRYQQRFVHILVDEFQDTNLAQFEIIRLLTAPQNNLFVVGDDWQSVYGWRGAVPENIIEFHKVYPTASTIKLEQNYRSTKTIVERSNKLISFNKVRTDKVLWTQNSKGHAVKILRADHPEHEASLIIKEIKALTNGKGLSYKDIAVLYRINAQSRALEDECIRQKIPYMIVGSLGFYDRREIKDMIAYLRLLHDLDDDEALLRIINVPPRYLGKAFVKELETQAARHKQSLFVSLGGYFSRPYMNKQAARFQELILELRHYYQRKCNSLSDLLKRIREKTGYDTYICQDEEIKPDDSRVQNLNELEAALSRFERIEDFLFYVDQLRASQRDIKKDHNQVSLMTLHKSKGLEFKAVFLAGCAQGLLPHHKALPARPAGLPAVASQAGGDDGGIEEERRLCYVGMTRAMDRLCISYPRTYQGKPAGISQFIREAFPEVKAGTRDD